MACLHDGEVITRLFSCQEGRVEQSEGGLRHLRASRYGHAARAKRKAGLAGASPPLDAGKAAPARHRTRSANQGNNAFAATFARRATVAAPVRGQTLLQAGAVPPRDAGSHRTGNDGNEGRLYFTMRSPPPSRFALRSRLPRFTNRFRGGHGSPASGFPPSPRCGTGFVLSSPFRPPRETCNQPFSHMLSAGRGRCALAGWVAARRSARGAGARRSASLAAAVAGAQGMPSFTLSIAQNKSNKNTNIIENLFEMQSLSWYS